MICPGCGKEIEEHVNCCPDCGAYLPKTDSGKFRFAPTEDIIAEPSYSPYAPPPEESKELPKSVTTEIYLAREKSLRKRRAISTVIFLAIFAGLIFLGIRYLIPVLEEQFAVGKRGKAITTLKNLASEAVSFSVEANGFYWEYNGGRVPKSLLTNKVLNLSSLPFTFLYYSDDCDYNDVDQGSYFAFLAIPKDFKKFKTAFYIDESHTIWETELSSEELLTNLLVFEPDYRIWTEANQSRCDIHGVSFKPIH